MRLEVNHAADFVAKFMKGAREDKTIGAFRNSLVNGMEAHFQNHWFPDKPFRGSAYRCMRICQNNPMDPLILEAGVQAGLSEQELCALLPKEMTLWVDPTEVSYRIGEEGSIGVILGNDASSDSDSPYSCSPASSPSPPPYPFEDTSVPGGMLFQASCHSQLQSFNSYLAVHSQQSSPSHQKYVTVVS